MHWPRERRSSLGGGGAGAFALEETPVHKGYHSSRKQPIDVAARKSPVFKAGKRLKEKVNGAGA